MATFKNKYSHKAIFTFEGETRHCIDGLYITDKKAEIKFLKSNPSFIELKEEKKIEPEIEEKTIEEIEIEEPEIIEEMKSDDDKTRDFIKSFE